MDIRPSKALGVKVVAMTTGISLSDVLSSLDPEYVVSDMSELEGVVERLMGGGN